MALYIRKSLPVLFLAGFVAFYYGWIVVWRDNDSLATLGGDLLSILGSLISAVWLFIGARRAKREKRRFWALLSLGSFQYFIAELVWYFYEQVLAIEGYDSGLVDVFYLLQVAFYLAAFTFLFSRLRKGYKLYKLIFDLLIIMTIAFTFSWHYLIGPILGDAETTRLTLLVNLAYPVSDLGLLLCGFGLYWGAREYFTKGQALSIFFALIIQSVVDSLYLYMLSVNEYFSGSVVDPLFMLCLLLIGYGGLLEGDREPEESASVQPLQEEPPRIDIARTLIPYVNVLILFLFMIGNREGMDAFIIGTGFSILFIIVRQLLIIMENHRLLLDLYSKTDELEASEQRYRSLFDYNPDAVYSLDLSGRIGSANSATSALLGYSLDELNGRNIWDFVEDYERNGVAAHVEQVKLGEPQSFELTVRSRNGCTYALSLTSIPIKVRNRIVGIFGIGKDITENKRNEEKITYLAYHDALTGLANRAYFDDLLLEAVKDGRDTDEMFAVIFIDLDRFKNVNDTLGHDFGDALLVSVAARLIQGKGDRISVARQGGDEFTLLARGVAGLDEVKDIAENILSTLSKPYRIHGQEIENKPSIGISVYPLDGDTPGALMKKADIALYEVKHKGRGYYRLYCESDPNAQRKLCLERDLDYALGNRELKLHYQPQIDVLTGRMTGVEALLRWNHPVFGLVYPGEFIHLAESSGHIVPIGEWVLRTACAQASAWHRSGHRLKMAVNLSPVQFQQHDLVGVIAAILEETSLPPSSLDLELTESSAIQSDAIAKLQKLKELGVQLSIDDFGTGFSSLSYLETFPVDKLKLAPVFARKIESGTANQTIISSIIHLAASLNMNVIAEGVETENQAAILKEIQCSEMQGYLFGRPVSAEEMESRLVMSRLQT